jgi:hypothetical protein
VNERDQGRTRSANRREGSIPGSSVFPSVKSGSLGAGWWLAGFIGEHEPPCGARAFQGFTRAAGVIDYRLCQTVQVLPSSGGDGSAVLSEAFVSGVRRYAIRVVSPSGGGTERQQELPVEIHVLVVDRPTGNGSVFCRWCFLWCYPRVFGSRLRGACIAIR